MVRLLYGEDSFRLNERLLEIKKDYDPISISALGSEVRIDKIKQEAGTLSLLTPQKLLILKSYGTNKSSKEELESWLKKIESGPEIVFTEEAVTKSNQWLFTLIKKYGKIEYFPFLKPFEVKNWVMARVKAKGGQISVSDADMLAKLLGTDLWRISNEIDKLIAFDPKISAENINKLVEPEFLDSIFNLIDAISEKNEKKALALTSKFLKEEGNESYLIAMIARQIRNLLLVKEQALTQRSESTIAAKLHLHPYVVKNTLQQARALTFDQLFSWHRLLVEADLEIKSGSEPKLVLVRLVHRYCA